MADGKNQDGKVTTDKTVATKDSSQSQLIQDLVNQFVAHKDDIGKLFQYFKENHESFYDFSDFLIKNRDGLASVLDMGKTAEGKAELMAKLPDKKSRDELAFMLDNRKQITSMQQSWLANDVNFIGVHASDLKDMAEFAADHPDHMAKLVSFAADAPQAGFWDTVNNLGKWFAIRHPIALGKMANFIEKYGKDLDIPPDDAATEGGIKDLQELGAFALANKDKITSIPKGLDDLIEAKQKEADAKHKEENRKYQQAEAKQKEAERLQAEARERAREKKIEVEHEKREQEFCERTRQDYVYLQKKDSKLYAEAMDLLHKRIAIGCDNPNMSIQDFDKAYRVWEKPASEFHDRFKQSCPEIVESSPLLLGREGGGLIERALKVIEASQPSILPENQRVELEDIRNQFNQAIKTGGTNLPPVKASSPDNSRPR